MKSITYITLFNSLQYPKFENIIYGKIVVNSENLINQILKMYDTVALAFEI